MAEPTEDKVHDSGETFIHPLDLAEKTEIEKYMNGKPPAVVAATPAPEPEPTPPAETPPEPAKEEPPKEEPPREEPPKEEPVQDAKPEPEKHKPAYRWKLMRDAAKAERAATERAKAEAERATRLEAELAEARAQAQARRDPWAAEPEIDDPLTKMGKEVEGLKARLAEQDATLVKQQQEQQLRSQQLQVRDQVLRDEELFREKHPDYRQALDFLIESRREEYDEMGVLAVGAETLLTQNEEAVKRHASELGKDPTNDDQLYESARDLSFRFLIDQDRQTLVRGAQALGTTVPERAYALATRRGYKAPTAEPQPIIKSAEEQARERVQQAVHQQAAATSLSALQTRAMPVSREIKTREDILKLTEAEIADLDQRNPGWDRIIFGG